jgi:hypothetical protein
MAAPGSFVSGAPTPCGTAIKVPVTSARTVTGGCPERTKEISMFLAVFFVLLVLWLMGFFAFHIAGGFIHLLLIIAVIALIVHLFRGRSMA